MGFYSTLADAYDELVLEYLSDILNEYPKAAVRMMVAALPKRHGQYV